MDPTLKINTNKKIAKGPWTTRLTDGRTYYTSTQWILTRALRPHALRAITVRVNDLQKATQTTGQRDGRISSTGPHWDHLNPSIGINALQCWTHTL